MAGNERNREPSLWEVARDSHPPPCEERDLFTTAKPVCRAGEQSKSETLQNLSTLQHVLYR
jgi:hypothetical protein